MKEFGHPQLEMVGDVFTMEALVPGGTVQCHVTLNRALPAGTKLYIPLQVQPEQQAPMAETMVRYCPECGTIGDVPAPARDCSPDGGHARMLPLKFAELCRGAFLQSIAQPEQQAPASSTDFMQRRGRDADIVDEALAEYTSWVANDCYDSKATLHTIMGRMRDRREMVQAEPQLQEPVGAPYGIIDPDYARVYTQARIIAWQYGFALVMHGSFTRDLDLILVPWENHACTESADRVVRMISEHLDLRIIGEPGDKPHGRKAYTLVFRGFGDPRWVDLSVVPVPSKQMPCPTPV